MSIPIKKGAIRSLMTWLSIFVGTIFILLSIIFDKTNIGTEKNHILSIFTTLLEVLGASVVVAGVVNIFIDMKDWRDYFSERLSEIVLKHSYMETLDSIQLRQIKYNISKILYRNESAGVEGGFLHHLQKVEEDFMTSPYREDISYDAQYSSIPKSGNFLVDEEIRYCCRKYDGKIQKDVSWIPEGENEFLEIRSFQIYVQYPPAHSKRGNRVDIYNATVDFLDNLAKKGVCITIPDEFRSIDQLIVGLKVLYVVSDTRFQTWAMAHPTKNFIFNLRYPDNFNIQIESLLSDTNLLDKTASPGYMRITYDSWVLPGNALVWQISR